MSISALLYSHPECFLHLPGLADHPENPDRLRCILEMLDNHEDFPGLLKIDAPLAELNSIYRAHDQEYVDAILSVVPEFGFKAIDSDTGLSKGSDKSILRAAGSVIAAVDSVLNGKAERAFCAVRPPGHHAERSRPMGFCFFNNVAIGAMHAIDRHNLDRVAVVDFDVHHGNGTQNIFRGNEKLFFASTHQSPFYPGTGSIREKGNNLVNIPLPSGTNSDEFRNAWKNDILPSLANFAPQIILISAGFDGHIDDPLAGWNLEADDFSWVTSAIIKVAQDTLADGKIISVLEGGYNHKALVECVSLHIKALLQSA